MSDAVTLSRHGDVAVIRIDDGKANALSFAILASLDTALSEIERDAKAAVVIGREGKFSAGFDLSVMTGGNLDDARRLLGAGAELGMRIFSFPIPVVLGVTGHALAMGGILATTADYRVGAAGPFKIGLNEVAIGMPVPAFAVELTRDRLAKKWFTRCIQSAHVCSPEEALDANFLDELVAPDAVEARSIEVAAQLAATVHPGPFRVTRRTIRGALVEQLRVGLEADLALFDVGT
jgi:enoyl-CoA hydratase